MAIYPFLSTPSCTTFWKAWRQLLKSILKSYSSWQVNYKENTQTKLNQWNSMNQVKININYQHFMYLSDFCWISFYNFSYCLKINFRSWGVAHWQSTWLACTKPWISSLAQKIKLHLYQKKYLWIHAFTHLVSQVLPSLPLSPGDLDPLAQGGLEGQALLYHLFHLQGQEVLADPVSHHHLKSICVGKTIIHPQFMHAKVIYMFDSWVGCWPPKTSMLLNYYLWITWVYTEFQTQITICVLSGILWQWQSLIIKKEKIKV